MSLPSVGAVRWRQDAPSPRSGLHLAAQLEKAEIRLSLEEASSAQVRIALQHGKFREDRYYRLSVAVIHLPPLCERRDDIPDLVSDFLQKHGAELGVADPSIHPEARQLLQAQPWPGNVRELENVIRKVLILANGYTILPDPGFSTAKRHPRLRADRRPSATALVVRPRH